MASPNFMAFVAILLVVVVLPMTANGYDDLNYLKVVSDATEFSSEEYYDYIVVGGGTAGCPLAATLSTNYSVLVLERGAGPQEKPQVLRLEKLLTNLVEFDDEDSPAQAFISEGVPNIRARVLGGGSMINVGLYSRGDEDFYIKSGVKWDMHRVNESFEWIEETVAFQPDNLTSWQSSVKEAFLEAGNGPYNGISLDHIVGTKIAGAIFDGSGRRHGAVDLLNKAEFKNLRVAVHATVERVIFSSSNSSGLFAVGVMYSDSTGRSHRAMLHPKGEVILSAGAIGSPQLLLLSGIGPQPYLSSLNISVVQHQPFVGQFLSDPPRSDINIVPPFPLESSPFGVIGITENGYYIEVFSFDIPFDSPMSSLYFPDPSPPVNFTLLAFFEKLSNTLSTGSLHLASSTDVKVSPIVHFNYFSNPEDLAKCVQGMRNIGKVMHSHAMEKYKFGDQHGNKSFKFVGRSLPENMSDDASLETFCRKTMTTIWHYHGGCLVGKVVDEQFRAIEINSLRIVDGSTFTASPGINPQATVMMLGRYVALNILEEREA